MLAYASSRYAYEGSETTETSITRVGGASDPTGQQQSRKIVTTANSQWLRPFKAEPYAIWNPTSGANVAITVCGIINAGALPNNDDIWMEAEYLGSSSSTLGTLVNTTKANLYAANAMVASNGSTWNVPAFTTWNPSDLLAMTLSNGNLTATNTTVPSGVRAKDGFASGKYYWEITVSTWAQPSTEVGFGLASATFTVGATNGAAYVSKLGGTIFINNVSSGSSLGGRSAGDIIGIALDVGNNLCWFRVAPSGNWNGSGTANPATGVGGISISAIAGTQFPMFLASGIGEVATANFGASTFSGAVPSGFTSGWPAVWSPFKLTTTLSTPQPGMAGYIHVRVRAAKPSTTFYIDPQIALTPSSGGLSNALSAYKSSRYAYEGTETTETSITRVGGASDPTGQQQSRKLVTTANSQWLRPFKAEPYAIWNPTSGANVAITVCGIINAGALPNNDDIWMDVEYLGSSSFPIGTLVNTTKANLFAANAAVASDGSTWNNTLATQFDTTSASNITLSNGNLTVTHSNTSLGGAQALPVQSSGKWYFEVTQTTTGHGGGDIIAALSPVPPVYSALSTGGMTVARTGGNVIVGGSSATLGAFAVGDVCGVAVDFNAGLVWFRRNAGNWNNSGTANPATGAGGLAFSLPVSLAPAIAFGGAATAAGDAYTINFGATSYANAAPSGFANWILWTPFKLTTTLSSPQPGMAGYLYARVRAAKPSTAYYIDPKILLS